MWADDEGYYFDDDILEEPYLNFKRIIHQTGNAILFECRHGKGVWIPGVLITNINLDESTVSWYSYGFPRSKLKLVDLKKDLLSSQTMVIK